MMYRYWSGCSSGFGRDGLGIAIKLAAGDAY
jgi:hypothetical protein